MTSLHKIAIYTILSVTTALAVSSCNSTTEDPVSDAMTNNSVAITKFALVKNDKVLANLDSVFFSIDLNNARIFNADSLPKGTDVSRLVLDIGTETVGGIMLKVDRGAKGDTVYNYIANQKDSIDFSHAPVIMTVTSLDGTMTRDYEVRVNVHTTIADSLYWNRTARRNLPTLLSTVTEQHTVELGDEILCFTTDGNSTCMARASHPGEEFECAYVSLPSDAQLSTLNAGVAEGEILVIDAAGTLYSTTDDCESWSVVGENFISLIGRYKDTVLAVKNNGTGGLLSATYPATVERTLRSDFPVKGLSQLLVFDSMWSDNPIAIMAGGARMDGQCTGRTWGYDGENWEYLNLESTYNLPPMQGVTLVPYFFFRTTTGWSVTRQSVLLAIGGYTAFGEFNRTVYISHDRGITWSPAPALLQLPDYISPRYGGQGFVYTKTMHVGGNVWQSMPDRPQPKHSIIVMDDEPASRADRPVDSWECPEIYLFGGITATGLDNSVWNGVINRLTFRPLY